MKRRGSVGGIIIVGLMTAMMVLVDDMECRAFVGKNNGAAAYMEEQCSSNEDCNPGECCVLGGNRYSIPQCSPLLDVGSSCRPNNVQLNTTLVYPDGNQIMLRDVYFIYCPCTYGLGCEIEDEGAVCRDPTQKRAFNHLLNELTTQDD